MQYYQIPKIFHMQVITPKAIRKPIFPTYTFSLYNAWHTLQTFMTLHSYVWFSSFQAFTCSLILPAAAWSATATLIVADANVGTSFTLVMDSVAVMVPEAPAPSPPLYKWSRYLVLIYNSLSHARVPLVSGHRDPGPHRVNKNIESECQWCADGNNISVPVHVIFDLSVILPKNAENDTKSGQSPQTMTD